jgi:TolB protein
MVRRSAVIAAIAALACAGAASAVVRHGAVITNVYFVDARSGAVSILTANPITNEDKLAYAPSWSPNAKEIVYAETRCHGCASEIRITRVHPVPAPLGRRIALGFKPRWSPTGSSIAFVDAAGNIETMRADGHGRRVVASGGLANDDPAWSPDGRMLAFSRQLTAADWSVYVVSARGGAAHPLVPRSTGQALTPAWSPDGRSVAFAQRAADGRWQIAVARRDGTHVRVISDGKGSDSSPTWSPDGRRIVFVREVGLDGNALYVMPASGGRARRLTPAALDAVQPQWAPRGPLVAFAARVISN